MLAAIEQNTEILGLPTSSVQQRFWVLDQLKPGDPSLNVAVRFSLAGRLDAGVLERALNEIVRRHEILRATFSMIDGQVIQLVSPTLRIPLRITDLRSLSEPLQSSEADRLAIEEARNPFALDRGPLLRASLLRIGDQEHTLLITIHHIVSDGWSIGVITAELGPIYEAFLEGHPSPLPELAIQYADYTIWEQGNRDASAWAEAEVYWKEQLADLPRFEVLPDRPRGVAAPVAGNIVSRLLPVELTDGLRELSRKNEATLFMTMFAALTALLQRYTGETDIVVGSQVVGRNVVDIEPLVGPFINTVVLRSDAANDPTFEDLLRRVRKIVSQALEHQDYPLEKVAEILRLDRTTDGNLMFQVNFIYQRDFVHPWEYGGIRMRPIPSRSPGAMYDLNVFLVERDEGWRLSCEYNTALYLDDTVARMLESLERLLSAVVDAPDRRISAYPLMDADEQERILGEWNRTELGYPRQHCVHQLFSLQTSRTPASVAVVCGRESITYRQLDERSNQLARYVQARGVKSGMLAGICVERSIDMLIAVLAVLKAGAAYVPLDPSFPPERLSLMAQDAGLGLLITQEKLAGIVKTAASTVLLDAEHKQIARHEPSVLSSEANPESLAYVIYTSGSTGKPKGVAIHHRALVNLLHAVLREPGISATDSLLAVTTLSFDIAGLELFAPLLAGGKVVLATREEASDGRRLREILASSAATVLQATPATWRMLIDSGWSTTPGLKMLCGGEPLPPDLASELLDRGGELWNMYGPTETTIWSSWTKVARDKPITIGRPAPNQTFYVLDPKLQPVPVGVPGELHIGGDGVATGYHRRTELTAERFLDNPFAAGRMYRTGDRARLQPDGAIEMLGRADNQVKVRGFRIELGEVESALSSCPGVRAAAVVARQDASGQNVLAGYFVSASVEGNSLRAHLKQCLPDYMIPAHLIPLAELPKTPNGKLDRKALPAPDAVRPEPGCKEAAPRDALESTLIGIWESVLNVRPIGRNDNFFEIGGHSVLAARMFARMEKVVGKALPLATLFQGPTIERLAALLRDGGWTPPWSSLVPIRPDGALPPFFFVHPIGGNVLSFAGFASHFDPDQPVYGLQARGLDGKQAPTYSVEQMAADYVQEIRAAQPHGPYHVGGFSAGGIVAFEMARKLREAGERVDVLALLDTRIDSPAPSSLAASSQRLSRWVRTIEFNTRYAFHIGWGPFLEKKLKNWRMRGNIRRWLMKKQLGANPGMLDAEEAFLLALRTYAPRHFEGDAILFRAKDARLRLPDATLGWGCLIRGQLHIEETSGDHDNILQEPHIGMLARLLNARLRSAYAGASSNYALPNPTSLDLNASGFPKPLRIEMLK